MLEQRGFSLQNRDREILHFLREQGVATFQQLERRFFTSRFSCSRRLSRLEDAGYLNKLDLEKIFPRVTRFESEKRYFPYLMGLGLRPGMAIYSLSDSYLKQVSDTKKLIKPNLVLHQLMLNDVRDSLEETLASAVLLNDPKLTILSEVDFDRRKEFTPDLSFECSEYKLAVELERTEKSINRYLMRFTYYDDSAYTHLLYVYTKDSHLKTLRECAGTARKVAFSHYLRPTELFSNTWGYLSLSEFIDRVNHIRKRN